jgi:hypothetical protein
MIFADDVPGSRNGSRMRGAAYALELCLIGAIYFTLAKLGLALALINPSATPIWPPTGLAIAALLNGVKTVDGVKDSQHAKGRIALRFGAGIVKFRKVEVQPL